MAKKIDIINNFLLTDSKDPSIKINNSMKLTKPIFNLIEINEYKAFLNSQDKQLSIKLKKEISLRIETEIKNNLKTKSDLKTLLNKYEIYLGNSKVENLNKSLLDKTKIINILSKEYNNTLKTISNLYKESLKIEKEEAIWTLHLCHLFIKGSLDEKDVIKAPLILIPINIKQTDGKLFLSKINLPTYNEKLNLVLEKKFGIKINEIFESKLKDTNLLSINQIIDVYNSCLSAANVKIDENHNIEKFIFEESSDLEKQKELTIDYSSCISLIDSSGGKLKKDSLEILDRNENPFVSYSILKNNDDMIDEFIKQDTLVEFSGELNLYQKLAVYSSLKGNCIINGPPGTGKSEVISNIVLNVLKQQKTSLIVSEKKAALDVLINRFGKIANLCLCSYDLNDSKLFYKKINDFHQLLLTNFNEVKQSTWDKQYQQLIDSFNGLNKLSKTQIHDFDYREIANYLNDSQIVYTDNWKDIIDQFDKIIIQNKLSIKDSYQVFLKLKTFANENKEYLSLFINKKFHDFKKNDLDKFLNKNINKKNIDYIVWNYINYQSLNTINFFNIKKVQKINFTNQQIINFLNQLKDFNLESINAFILGKIATVELTEQEFITGILQKNIYDSLKVTNNELLQNNFDKYLKAKIESSKNNEEYYLIQNIKKFQEIYNLLTVAEKQEIDTLFAKAKMNNKQSINSFASNYFEKLKLIFPIWLMNPSSCSVITPNKRNLFDYGIFDEASQMFLERAFPIVYRSNINIIAGDDKQLKPTSFFQLRYDNIDESNIDNVESLLERAKLCLWPTYYLKNHYRCDHANLISFSSENFYNNNLEYISKNGVDNNALEVVNVKGIWSDEVNEIEANKTIELVEKYINNYQTIMVVTLNKKQLDLIEKLFYKKFGTNKKIIEKYENDKLMFKNLENIQGHESDMVILSIGYGFNKDKKLINSFGPITQKNGSNRLNVAITRAKQKMIVIKSFNSDDMKINNSNNEALLFYKYINFLDNLKNNSSINKNEQKENIKFHQDVLYHACKNFNFEYTIQKNINIGSTYIDYGIYNKQNKLILAINFDKEFAENNFIKTIDNLFRNKFINDRGYKLININDIEWYFNKDKVISQINNFTKEIHQ